MHDILCFLISRNEISCDESSFMSLNQGDEDDVDIIFEQCKYLNSSVEKKYTPPALPKKNYWN